MLPVTLGVRRINTAVGFRRFLAELPLVHYPDLRDHANLVTRQISSPPYKRTQQALYQMGRLHLKLATKVSLA
jgi:hypothetical protein